MLTRYSRRALSAGRIVTAPPLRGLPAPLPDLLGASAALAFWGTWPWWLLWAWLFTQEEEQ